MNSLSVIDQFELFNNLYARAIILLLTGSMKVLPSCQRALNYSI